MLTTLLATLLLGSGSFSPIGVNGPHFTTAEDKDFILKGVNLGGWLVEEVWMTPWVEDPPAGSTEKPVKDHVSLWRELKDRLGEDQMEAVRDAWRDNWITPYDLQTIKRAGFNHVRLPFLDSLLDEPNGLKRLHKCVDMIEKAGLYVVLDMHGLPGSQSNEHHTGEQNRNRLWFDVENITKAEKDWALVGKEFGKDPGVAAFDLMNEPMGAPNPSMLFLVFDRLYRAIRTTAPHKVLLIEDGYKGLDTTPHPNLAQWTDVAYSLHFYNFDAKKPEDHVIALKQDTPKIQELLGYRQTPMYVGEWNVEPFGGAKVIDPYVKAMNAASFSWCFWCWKEVGKIGLGDWGIVRPKATPSLLNPFTDSAEGLINKIKMVRTENLEVPSDLLKSFNG